MNPPESEDPSLANMDLVLVAIFLKELASQANHFKNCLASLHADPHDKKALDQLIKTIQEVVQGGKIIRIDPLVNTGKIFESYLKGVREGRYSISDAGETCMHQMLAFLISFSLISPSQLDLFMQGQRGNLEGIDNQIQGLEKDKMEIPKIKEEQPKPASEELTVSSLDGKMADLFRIELEMQSKTLSQGLIELEKKPNDSTLLEKLMRAAHSIKGAARVVALNPIVRLAHAMEDCFVAAQHQQLEIREERVDLLLKGVDLLGRLAELKWSEMTTWTAQSAAFLEPLILELSALAKSKAPTEAPASTHAPKDVLRAPANQEDKPEERQKIAAVKAFQASYHKERVLRITAENLNRLMGLAGESLVETRWLYPFGESLQLYKSHFRKFGKTLDLLRNDLKGEALNEAVQHHLIDLHEQVNDISRKFSEHVGELDHFIGRHSTLSDRLYAEVVNSRMRPFADGVEAFPRMVRDLGREFGKSVRLEITGQTTQVDRDLLEKLESPLSHLLRNAVVHGIEAPEVRRAAGKSPEGVIILQAGHQGGMLAITVSDDGGGIDIEKLRSKIIDEKYLVEDLAKRLTLAEVVDFLFLPGFSTAPVLDEIAGRGVGLNIVQTIVQEVGGGVRVSFTPGEGAKFHLQLPVTLSVIHALLIEISEEVYALPLARIDHSLLIDRQRIETIENRQFFHHEDQNIGLVPAWQVLELKEPKLSLNCFPVIVLSDLLNRYGLVVDRLIGEKELVVHELDARLGKVPDVMACSVLEDGSPVLILDVEDLVRSIDHLLSGGRLTKLTYLKQAEETPARKRVLIVDDSITVREVESRLLKNQGYEVDTAVNGMDGWNALRTGHYDLVISDVDMPRMNGIELLKAIKSDPLLKKLPVMIVSYKSTEEDRLKGLAAGADYYLTKSSFHDTTLIEAVDDLIG